MNISMVEIEIPTIESVLITENVLNVQLSDGRGISVPLDWFPRLLHSTARERKSWKLIGKGYGIHWESVDEDISVENLLAGKPSGESQSSFGKWLETRTHRPTSHSSGRAHGARH